MKWSNIICLWLQLFKFIFGETLYPLFNCFTSCMWIGMNAWLINCRTNYKKKIPKFMTIAEDRRQSVGMCIIVILKLWYLISIFFNFNFNFKYSIKVMGTSHNFWVTTMILQNEGFLHLANFHFFNYFNGEINNILVFIRVKIKKKLTSMEIW